MKPRIIFFGTPEFAVPTLEALVRAGYAVVAVITQPDKPVGRGLKMEAPPVKKKAEELGLRVWQPSSLRDGAPSLSDELHADAGIAVAYGKIIPQTILDLFPRGILNVHPSLLPKYRGPSPIQAAMLNGDTETGVTIILLDEEMDHGPLLAYSVQRIADSTAASELSHILAQKGAELLAEILPKYLAGKIAPQPQDHARATFTKLLEREDGRMDWNKPAEYIERTVRAYDFWPGTWTQWNDKRIKIIHTLLLHSDIGCAKNTAPGYVWRTDDGCLSVNCNPGSIILNQLQLEGKKVLTGLEFLRGHPKFLGSILQ